MSKTDDVSQWPQRPGAGRARAFRHVYVALLPQNRVAHRELVLIRHDAFVLHGLACVLSDERVALVRRALLL